MKQPKIPCPCGSLNRVKFKAKKSSTGYAFRKECYVCWNIINKRKALENRASKNPNYYNECNHCDHIQAKNNGDSCNMCGNKVVHYE